MKRTTLLLSLTIGVLTLSTSALATPFTVAATANIFSAGQVSAGSGSADGSGTAPFVASFAAGGGNLTFSGVTGTVNCGSFCTNEPSGPTSNGPDGASYNNMRLGAMNITAPGNGISGIQFTGREMMLVAVFLDNNVPTGPGPSNFAPYDVNFADNAQLYSPGIAQVFIVGNGLTGGPGDVPGLTQTFVIPTTATRLFLGFADAQGFTGLPTMYGDNIGSLAGNFNISINATPTPEPGTMLLMGLSFAGLALLRKKLA